MQTYESSIVYGKKVVRVISMSDVNTISSEIDIDSKICGNIHVYENDIAIVRKCYFFTDNMKVISYRMDKILNTIIDDLLMNFYIKLEEDLYQNSDQVIKNIVTEIQNQIFTNALSLEQRYNILTNLNLEFRKNTYVIGFLIGQIPGGILAYIYPAHNVFGITIPLATIFYLIILIIKDTLNEFPNIIIYSFSQLFHGLLMGMAAPACNGIWKLWAQQNERPILSTITLLNKFTKLFQHDLDIILDDRQTRTLVYYLLVIMGFIWYILWSYIIYGNSIIQCRNKESLDNTPVSIQPSFFNIPWKKIFTSIPVYAIIIASICDESSIPVYNILIYTYIIGNINFTIILKSIIIFIKFFIVLSIFGMILTNYCRDHRLFSTAVIRKMVTCFSFVVQSILLLIVFYDEVILSSTCGVYWLFIFGFFKELGYFGYGVNPIDIAPMYAGILMGVVNTVGMIFQYFSYYIFGIMYQYKIIYDDQQLSLLSAVFLIIGALFYCCCASGVLQPWTER